MTNRRSVLHSGLAALTGLPAAALAQQLPSLPSAEPASPPILPAQDSAAAAQATPPAQEQSGELERYIRLIGSLSPQAIYTAFEGVLWGVLPGQMPVAICGFHTLARHEWTPREDGSFLQQRFELGYFSALDAHVPAATLLNPLSGEQVEPFHYRRGGGQRLFSTSGRSALDPDGTASPAKPLELGWHSLAGSTWLTEQYSTEYPAPFDSEQWPRESAGSTYFSASETTYSASTAQLEDSTINSASQQLFWSLIASWEPWLLMGDQPGFVLWRGVGAKLRSPLEAPEALRNYALGKEPRYFAPGVPWAGRKSTAEEFQQERKPAPAGTGAASG